MASRGGNRVLDDNRTSTGSPVRAVWIAVLTALCAFAAIVALVQASAFEHFDRWLMLLARNPDDLSDARGPPWFEETAVELSALGGYPVVVTIALIVLIGLLILRKRLAALFLLVALAGGSALSTLAKMHFARARPDLVDHMDRTFTMSFPSGHAMISTVAYLTLAAVTIRFVPHHRLRLFIAGTAIALAVLIGASRVYLGVHWPSDVLAGWSLGGAWAGLCWLVFHRLERSLPRSVDLGQSQT